MKFTRRGLFGLIAGAVTGTTTAKAKPLIHTLPGGAALKYPVTITKVMVKPRARKLMGTWTMECSKDLKALHGIDADTELTLPA
jgi:hypothetical protein